MSASQRRAAQLLEHAPDCPAPNVKGFRDMGADRPAVRCTACGAESLVDRLVAPPRPRREAAPAPAAVETGYRCRTHGSPVTWRGQGCAQCAAERAHDRATRAARRRAAQLAATERGNRQ